MIYQHVNNVTNVTLLLNVTIGAASKNNETHYFMLQNTVIHRYD